MGAMDMVAVKKTSSQRIGGDRRRSIGKIDRRRIVVKDVRQTGLSSSTSCGTNLVTELLKVKAIRLDRRR